MSLPDSCREPEASSGSVLRFLLTWASLVVIVAGMKAASALVVPFLLALFLAILSAPALQWLCDRGLRQWLAMLIVISGVCAAFLVLVVLMTGTINQFLELWPRKYEARIGALADGWNEWIDRRAEQFEWFEKWNDDLKFSRGDQSQWTDLFEPGRLMRGFSRVMRAFSGVLSQTLLILATTIFLLAEGATFPGKLAAISGGAAAARIAELRRIARDVNSYMAIKTCTSLLTGGLVTAGLWLLDVDFAILWGLTAFLLNYVPNIGSILAAVPAVLLAMLQHGPGTTVVVIGLYVMINMAIGYLIEPRWMGKGLGLSTLVVFVSLVFWGWVLGPVGMVISVPLTMAVRIALENNEQTRWLAILMGPQAV